MSRKNNNDRHANLTEPPTSRKVALITGGSARLGATIVKSLHSNGYDIGLHYLHSEKDAHLLVTQLNEQRPGSAFALRQDLAEDDAATKIREHFLKKRGRMDLLVNNASIFKKTQTEFPSPSEWERIFSVNSRSPWMLALSFAPLLRQHQGAVINITDIHAKSPRKDYSLYCISKATLDAITRTLALELAPEIRVNGIAPGAILWAASESEKVRQEALASTPLNRRGEPLDIASAVVYLASANYVSGQILNIDGGRSLTN
jgi:pteridine reductase